MERPLQEFQAQLAELVREVGELRRRLERLETLGGIAAGEPSGARPEPVTGGAAPEGAPFASLTPARSIALIGRTLVVLAGAYLLRAISETEVIPALVGALAGLAYAAWWLVQADRTAGKGERLSALFHGFASVMIAYPLIWETTARFELLDASAASAALVLLPALGLTVAVRRDLQEIAWIVTLAALATTIGLIVGTHHYLPYTLTLLLIAALVEGLAFRDRWLELRWPVALALHLAVLMMISAALRPDAVLEGYTTLGRVALVTVGLGLPLLYLSTVGARTLLRECPVTPFEIVQAPVALLVGFSAAVRVIAAVGADPSPIGIAIFLLGVACYAAAFTTIDRRLGRTRNFYTYTTLGGLLVLVGSEMFLTGAVLAFTWSALAIGAVLVGVRFNRITLKFHGAVYVTAAATVSGLMSCAFDGLLADPAGTWHPVTSLGMAAALVALVCYGILVTTPGRKALRWFELLPQAIVGAVVLWSVAGMAAPWVTRGVLAASSATAEAAFLAASRTAVIAVLAVALAWAGRHWSLEELIWLVYPLLVGGGAKLLWEDFQYGEPMTLFIALAFYGGALILTPRLIRKEA
jgi:hypothetical protein